MLVGAGLDYTLSARDGEVEVQVGTGLCDEWAVSVALSVRDCDDWLLHAEVNEAVEVEPLVVNGTQLR